jgi:hypothetical protein
MGVYADPIGLYLSPDYWSGSDQDDTLVYKAGSDTIDGKGGYDVLVIPFRKVDSVTGIYANNSITIDIPFRYYQSIVGDPAADKWTTMNVTAVNIEQLQFSDQVVTLIERVAPTSEQISIPWGDGGSWIRGTGKKSAYLGFRHLRRSRSGVKSKYYLVDRDFQVYPSGTVDNSVLSISGGSWADTEREYWKGGTMLYSGSNMIAFFQGLSEAQFDAATKV